MSSVPTAADFDAAVKEAMARWHVPGLSVSMIHKGESWSKGYGLADLSSKAEVEPGTLFYAASTTKAQLCAVWAIYMHSDANKKKPANEQISWSTQLAQLIRDDFVLEDPIRTQQVSLEDAVSHRTGMSRHDLCYGNEGPNTLRDLTRHLRHLPLQHELRTKHAYCNTMYTAAAHALEVVTGMSLSRIMHDWLWEPLGMNDTYLRMPEAQRALQDSPSRIAKPYVWTKNAVASDFDKGEHVEQPHLDCPELCGAGEVISTADDYIKWMRCLVSSSAPLNEDITKELWTARSMLTEDPANIIPFDGGLLNYGLGWFISAYRGYKCLWHPGGVVGAGSLIMVVPELQWGCSYFGSRNDVGFTLRGLPLVLLDQVIGSDGKGGTQDTSNARVQDAAIKLYRDIAKKYAESKQKLYPDAPASTNVPLALPLEAYAGTYSNKAYGRLTFSIDRDAASALTCLIDNKTWSARLTLEHVNGEYWFGTQVANGFPVSIGFRAQSRVGVDGKVEALGLVMEVAMPEKLFWFDRQRDA